MPTDASELVEIARGGGKGRGPDRGALDAALQQYRASAAKPLGSLLYRIDGTAYPSFYAAVRSPTATFAEVEIAVQGATYGPSWELLRPFRRLTFRPDGSAAIHPPTGPTERAIARLAERDGFYPKGERGHPLSPLPVFVDRIRSGLGVPFGAALLLYCPNERVRYEIDLVGDALRPDPWAGRLPGSPRVRWSARRAWRLDQTLARAGLSSIEVRAVEAIAEREASSPEEFLPRGLDPSVAGDVPAALERRGFIERADGTGQWRFHAAALEGPAPLARSGASPEELPELRRSMNELLADAEARATCPMCGDEFTPGASGILCAKCEREVSSAGARP